MAGVNKVILIGNLGADPETRATAGGDTVVTLNLATSETWKDKNSGERQERTEWHRIVFFGKPADVIAQYCAKGSKLYIEGQLRTRKWQDKEGQDRYTTEVNGREFQFLDSKGEGGSQPQGDGNQGQGQRQGQQRKSQPAAAQPAPGGDFEYDDDIPF